MNKALTIAILLVVLGAMGIVFYTSTEAPVNQMATTEGSMQGNGTVVPLLPPANSPSPVIIGDTPAVTVPAAKPELAPQQPAIVTPPVAVAPPVVSAPVAPVQKPEVAPAIPTTLPVPVAPVVDNTPRTPAVAPVKQVAPQEGNKPSATAEAVNENPVVPPKKVEQKHSLTGEHEIKEIGVHFAGQQMKLRIVASNGFPCKTFVLPAPDRLVVDLPGKWKGVKAPNVPANKIVKGVRIGKQDAGPRLVLDLERPLKAHTVERPDENTVEILFN